MIGSKQRELAGRFCQRRRNEAEQIAAFVTGLFVICFLLCSEASAQGEELFRPEKIRVDENGIDVATGRLVLPSPSIAVGDPEAGGLSYSLSQAGNWGSGYQGSVSRRHIQLGLSYFYVNGGLTSDVFSYDGTSFTSVEGTGATLIRTSTQYIYTASDGSVFEYARRYQHPSTPEPGEGDLALLKKWTRPSGEIVTIAHQSETAPCSPQGDPGCFEIIERMSSVMNNYGHKIRFEYAFNGEPSTIWEKLDWGTLTRAVAFNLAVDQCGCDSQYDWPSLTFSGNHIVPASVENSVGETTYYTPHALNPHMLEAVRYPGSSSDDIEMVWETGSFFGERRVTSLQRFGQTWTYSYSDTGDPESANGAVRVMTVTQPGGGQRVITSRIYDQRNVHGRKRELVLSIRDQLNRTIAYQYDAYDRVTRVTFPEGNYIQYTYDARGNVIETRRVAKAGSGLADIVTSATYPATCSNHKTCNQPTTTTDARGFVTDYTYDATHGGVLTQTLPDPDGAGPLPRPQKRYSYAQKQARYKNGPSSYVNGDPIWALVEVSECATGSSCDNAATETVTTTAFPSAVTPNNLLPVSTTVAAGDGSVSSTETYGYDAVGNLVTVDGPLAGAADTTRYYFDAVRRPAGMAAPDPDGAGPRKHRAERTTYNARGLPALLERGTVADQTDAGWPAFAVLEKQETLYDVYGRPIESRVFDGAAKLAVTQTSYDAVSRKECVAVRMNPAAFGALPSSACSLGTAGAYGPDRITKTFYDLAGQVTKTTLALGTSDAADDRVSTYRANGLLETLKDANGNMTTYEYDGHDRLVKTRFPHPSTAGTSSTTDYEAWTYDAAGNKLTERRRDGQIVSIAYDALNRRTLRDAPGTAGDVTFGYDNRGLLMSNAIPGHAMSFAFDALGRQVSETGPLGAVSYQYDAAGNNTRVTWPDGFYVRYDYDAAGQLTKARENGAASGAGVLASYAYDDLGRRASLTRGNGVATTYGYDAASRLASLSHDLAAAGHDQGVSFARNPASQITNRATTNPVYRFTDHVNVDVASAYNGLNQPTTIGGASISHDERGNLTSDGTTAYGYDVDNRLVSGSGGAALKYDAGGRLIETAKTGSATVRFLYAGPELIGEYDASGTLQRRYAHGASIDEPVVWYEGAGTADRRWLVADERGSIIAVTDGAGAALAVNSYDVYGKPGAGNLGRFAYTGQTFIPEVGLYHYKARFYSPDLGRFMQTDPIGYEDQMNLYAYVGNDPVNAIDPFGLYPTCAAFYEGTGSSQSCTEIAATGQEFDTIDDAAAAAGNGVQSLTAQDGNEWGVAFGFNSETGKYTVSVAVSGSSREGRNPSGDPASVDLDPVLTGVADPRGTGHTHPDGPISNYAVSESDIRNANSKAGEYEQNGEWKSFVYTAGGDVHVITGSSFMNPGNHPRERGRRAYNSPQCKAFRVAPSSYSAPSGGSVCR